MSSSGGETDDEGDDPPAPVPIVSLGSSSSLSVEARVLSPSERGQLGFTVASGPPSVPASPVPPFSLTAGRWLRRVLDSIAVATKGDTYECLACLGSAYPRSSYEALSQMNEEGAVARAVAISRHRWRGALPNWHPLVLGGSRAAGRAAAQRLSTSSGRRRGKYTGVSSGGESGDESVRPRSISLVTEDELSPVEFGARVEWVVTTQAALVEFNQADTNNNSGWEAIQGVTSSSSLPTTSPTPTPSSQVSFSSSSSSVSPPAASSSSSSPPPRLSPPSGPVSPAVVSLAALSMPPPSPAAHSGVSGLETLAVAESPDRTRFEGVRSNEQREVGGDEHPRSEVGSIVITPPSQCATPVPLTDSSRTASLRLRNELDSQTSRGEGLAFAIEVGNVDEVGTIQRRRAGGLAKPGVGPPRRYRAKFREDAQCAEEGSDAEEDETSLLPSSSWLLTLDCLPSSSSSEVLLARDDYARLREWIAGLPQGHAASEPSLYPLQHVTLVQGGRVGIVRGEGVGELGSATVDLDGNRIDWESEVEVVEEWISRQTSWKDIELSELLPLGSQHLLGDEESGEDAARARTDLFPRVVWRSVKLTRTSRARCAGCLCADLESRSVEDARLRSWTHSVRVHETQAWRRRFDSVRQLVFRRHTCGYGRLPAGHWHGVMIQDQDNIRGGTAGWEVRFRVLITAAIPTSHTNPYLRGVQDIDVAFRFPIIFRAMFGEQIRMRGRLRWDGRRPSRGQPMGFTWMPLEGDGEGLRGPVQFAGWWFGSDFVYGERPDIEVWLITLQVAAFSPIDQVSRVAGSQRSYLPPAFVVEARKERNASRRRRRGQKRPQPVSADESDGLPGTLRADEVDAMRLLPGANVLSHTRPPVSASVISSLPRPDTPLPSDTTSILARPVAYDGVSGLVPLDNPFGRSGGHMTPSSRDVGGHIVNAPSSEAASSMEAQVGHNTEFCRNQSMRVHFLLLQVHVLPTGTRTNVQSSKL